VGPRAQKHLVLIFAREFASNLATPMLLTDADGTLVFFNEAAEAIVGSTFAEAGEMSFSEWSARSAARTLDGRRLSDDERAAGIALHERRPAHQELVITGLDGSEREIELTAFPLFAYGDEFLGVVLIFWPRTEG
jgi:PAS domain S-box-containing protein